MNNISQIDSLKKFKSGCHSEAIDLWATELKKNALNGPVRKSLTQAKDHLESSEEDDAVKTNYLNKISSLQSFYDITFSEKSRDSSEKNRPDSPISGIKVSASGDILISDDFNHQVQIYDSRHNLKFTFGKKGNNPGEFYYPKGIDTDTEGNIYVADSWNHRIQKFSVDGKPISSFGSYGTGPGQFNEPSGVAISKNKDILVVDRCNHRIQWLDEKGNSLGSIGHRGRTIEEDLAELFETPSELFTIPSLEFPSDIAIDSKNDIYIVDSNNHRVLKFNSNGKFILSFGREGKEEGELLYPQSIAIDSDDNIFISDLNNERVQLFSPVGEHYFSFSQNNGNDNIDSPTILACGKEGTLFVGSAFNPKVLAFSYHPTSQEERTNLKKAIGVNSAESLYFSGNLLCRGGNCDKAAEKYEEALSSVTSGDQTILPELPLNYLKAARENLKEDISSKLLNYYAEELSKQSESILKTYKKRKDITVKLIGPILKDEMNIIEDKFASGDIDKSLYELNNEERSLFRKTREQFLELKRTQGFQDEMFRQLLPQILLMQNKDVIKTLIQKALSDFYHHLDMINMFLGDYDSQNSKCFEEIQKGDQDPLSLKDFRLEYKLSEVANDFITLAFPILKSSIHSLSQIALQLSASKNDSIVELFVSLTEEVNLRKAGRALLKLRYDFDTIFQFKDSLKILFSRLTLNSNKIISNILKSRTVDREALLNMDKFNYEKDLIEMLFVEEMGIVENENGLRFGLYSLTASDLDSFHSLKESEEKYTEQINSLKKAIDRLLSEKKQIDLIILNHETNLKSIHPGDQKSRLQIINEYNLVNAQSIYGNKLILEHLFLYRIINFKQNSFLLLSLELEKMKKNSKQVESINQKINYDYREVNDVLSVLKKDIQETRNSLFSWDNKLRKMLESPSETDRAREIEANNNRFQLNKNLRIFKMLKNEYSSVANFQREIKSHFHIESKTKEESVFVTSCEKACSLEFGSSGNRMGQFNYPTLICVDKRGDIFVSDTFNHRVQKFDLDGNSLFSIGQNGTYRGYFNQPFGILCDQDNNLFVCDSINNRIQKFDPHGNHILSFGKDGNKEESFNRPMGICMDSEGFIYIADMQNHRVKKYSPDGKLALTFGKKGNNNCEFLHPTAICFFNEHVLVGEMSSDRIQAFDRNGNFIWSYNYSLGIEGNKCGASDINVDKNGYIYVNDMVDSNIYVFSENFKTGPIIKLSDYLDANFGILGGMTFAEEYVFLCDNANDSIYRFPAKAFITPVIT